jgi:hypothetical protein
MIAHNGQTASQMILKLIQLDPSTYILIGAFSWAQLGSNQ